MKFKILILLLLFLFPAITAPSVSDFNIHAFKSNGTVTFNISCLPHPFEALRSEKFDIKILFEKVEVYRDNFIFIPDREIVLHISGNPGNVSCCIKPSDYPSWHDSCIYTQEIEKPTGTIPTFQADSQVLQIVVGLFLIFVLLFSLFLIAKSRARTGIVLLLLDVIGWAGFILFLVI